MWLYTNKCLIDSHGCEPINQIKPATASVPVQSQDLERNLYYNLISTEKKTPPPKKQEKECLKVYECIIKCSEKKLGFTVGEETSNGCRSCKCLMEEHSTGGSSGYKWTTGSGGFNTGNSNGNNGHKWVTGSGGSNTGNSNGGGNNFLKCKKIIARFLFLCRNFIVFVFL